MKLLYRLRMFIKEAKIFLMTSINRANYQELLYRDSYKLLIIDVIGASGVGKTTLINSLKRDKKLKFKRTMIKEENSFNLPLHEWEINFLIENFKKIKNMYDLHNIQNIRRKITIDKSLRLRERGTFVVDEGLLYSKTFASLINDSANNVGITFANRLVIHMITNNLDIIVNQIRKRHRFTGRIVAGHKSKTDDDLVKGIQSEINNNRNLARLYLTNGATVLNLYVEDGLKTNIEKIRDTIINFHH